eukprot:TRINITY_DN6100_c0_g1_i1.p2 TRINITY_DN6100_c0_g1~~TRINITY_DN6100_c0_g1_i1.p2  ORF type:complete len:101 (+),score=48.66 TRINITY_DN6100_c0_g1_i1:376-678(+)
MSKDGYEFITGGKFKHIYKYNLITLKAIDMLTLIDAMQRGIKETLSEFMSDRNEITAMSLTGSEGCQQLLVGMNTGTVYTFKYSPRIIAEKLIISFKNLM